MSNIDGIFAAVKRVRGLTISERLMRLSLAYRAAGERVCFPSQNVIAKETELSERTVRSALARLGQKGLISREHRYGPECGRASDAITIRFLEAAQ